jgi:hypothetical protein
LNSFIEYGLIIVLCMWSVVMLKWEVRVLYCMGSGGTEENIFSRE